MEVILEPVFHVLVVLVLMAVAYTVGTMAFLLVRAARVSLARLDGAADVVDPEGRIWSVRVALAPPPLRYRLSSWLFPPARSTRPERTANASAPRSPLASTDYQTRPEPDLGVRPADLRLHELGRGQV